MLAIASPLTIVALAIAARELPVAFSEVVPPLTLVCVLLSVSVLRRRLAFTVLRVVEPFTLVNVSLRDKLALARSLVVDPISFKRASVRPLHFALSVALIVLPEACVGSFVGSLSALTMSATVLLVMSVGAFTRGITPQHYQDPPTHKAEGLQYFK